MHKRLNLLRRRLLVSLSLVRPKQPQQKPWMAKFSVLLSLESQITVAFYASN